MVGRQHQPQPVMNRRKAFLKALDPLLSPITEGVIITDQSGLVVFHNPAVQRLFGIEESDRPLQLNAVGNHNLRTLLLDRSLIEKEKSGRDQYHCEITLEFDHRFIIHGLPRWLRINTCLVDVPGEGGRLRMILLRDVSAEKRLFATLGDKEACGISTADPDMLQLLERLAVVARTDASVLLQGESGTGKTELARLIHRRSRRADRPFVEVNCGAIPASLIETELFGHVKGAFTGAHAARLGRFKAADGGTLFLDEIGELPRELQPKLLRVLQDGEYEPVGSDKTERVDVRLACAANRNLRDMVDDGGFRADLYYRIAVVTLNVPPLRQRPGDIPLLVDVLLRRLTARGYPADIRVGAGAMRSIMNYPWPGNVRELANAVEHSVICAQDGEIVPSSLPDAILEYCNARQHPAKAESAPVDDRGRIEAALRKANGNKTLAAQILGIDRSTLWRRMRRLGMD
jgi:transcriptional regulator with GAF, ATPase, and Fis domain